jgi:hypothetical protein
MFCARRPGIVLSAMRALNSLRIDIEQGVISCFNGFAMDIFRGEVRTSPAHHYTVIVSNPTIVVHHLYDVV